MSAHSASHRGGWLSALVAQVTDYVLEEAEDTIEQPTELVRHPVIAVAAASPRSGATTVARLLAAELGGRADAAAVVVASAAPRRAAPPSRAAIRLATALAGATDARPVGRLCIVPADVGAGGASAAGASAAGASEQSATVAAAGASALGAVGASASGAASERRAALVEAARYLAPVVLDLPADGSAAGVAAIADRVVVVTAATGQPALLDAVATVIGGDPIKVVTRVADPVDWADRADLLLPDSRLGARAAALGTRALGAMGSQIAALADALEAER